MAVTFLYAQHFAALGKMCKGYDDAAAGVAAQETLEATAQDQLATGVAADNGLIEALQALPSQLKSARVNGAEALQATWLAAAQRYVVQARFYTLLKNHPAAYTPLAVMTALALEMSSGSGNDNLTLGTLTTTGLVHFFNLIAGDTLTWNTKSDSTADYRDAIYVVSAVI